MTPPNIDSTTDLGQHLRHDVRPARAERLAQADLARPLGHHHQHDVHDHDAADDERQRDDADEHGEDAVGGRVVDVEDGVGREDAEVVAAASASARARCEARRSPRPSGRRCSRRSRGFTVSDSERRDPKMVWNCPSGMIANSSCDCPSSEPRLRADADDAEVHAFDLDDLVERIDVDPNRRSAVCQPSTATGRDVSTSVGLISRPRSASKVEKLTYSP